MIRHGSAPCRPTCRKWLNPGSAPTHGINLTHDHAAGKKCADSQKAHYLAPRCVRVHRPWIFALIRGPKGYPEGACRRVVSRLRPRRTALTQAWRAAAGPPQGRQRSSALRVSTTGFIPIAGKMCGVARSRERLRFIDTFQTPRLRKARGFFRAGARMAKARYIAESRAAVPIA
jgi:hypothetical protein